MKLTCSCSELYTWSWPLGHFSLCCLSQDLSRARTMASGRLDIDHTGVHREKLGALQNLRHNDKQSFCFGRMGTNTCDSLPAWSQVQWFPPSQSPNFPCQNVMILAPSPPPVPAAFVLDKCVHSNNFHFMLGPWEISKLFSTCGGQGLRDARKSADRQGHYCCATFVNGLPEHGL